MAANIGSTAVEVVSESAAVAAAASDTLIIPLKVATETFHSLSTFCLGLPPPHLASQKDILGLNDGFDQQSFQLLSATSSGSGGADGTGVEMFSPPTFIPPPSWCSSSSKLDLQRGSSPALGSLKKAISWL